MDNEVNFRHDFRGLKNVTATKNKVREVMFNELWEYFSNKYGVDSLSKTGNTEFAAEIGITNDRDGFEKGVVITIKPVVKSWQDGEGSKRKIEEYDRDQEEYLYKLEKGLIQED